MVRITARDQHLSWHGCEVEKELHRLRFKRARELPRQGFARERELPRPGISGPMGPGATHERPARKRVRESPEGAFRSTSGARQAPQASGAPRGPRRPQEPQQAPQSRQQADRTVSLCILARRCSSGMFTTTRIPPSRWGGYFHHVTPWRPVRRPLERARVGDAPAPTPCHAPTTIPNDTATIEENRRVSLGRIQKVQKCST